MIGKREDGRAGEVGRSRRRPQPARAKRLRRPTAMSTAVAAATAGAWLVSHGAPARADTYTFNIVNDLSYGDATNWQDVTNGSSPSKVPDVGDIAYVVNGNVAYIGGGNDATANPTYNASQVFAGTSYGSENYGEIIQQGGTLNVSSYLVVGGGNTAGEYDISAGTINASGNLIQLVGIASSVDSAVMRISNTAVVNANGALSGLGLTSMAIGDLGGYGHLYLSDQAVLNSPNIVYVGVGSGSVGVMDMSGGTFNTGAGFIVGGYYGTGTLNLTGGTVTQSNASSPTYLGYLAATGTWNVMAGNATLAGELRVGGSDTSGALTGNGYFNVSGGTVTLGSLTLGRGNNYQNVENGYANLTGGTVTSVNDVVVAFAGAGTGSLNIAGGTLNVGTTATKWLQVGVYDTTSAVVNISSGALNLNTNTCIRFSTGGNSGGNVVNQTGGTVTFYSDDGVTVGGTGVLDMQEASGTGAVDTYNLYGGTLTVPQIISSQTNGLRTFNFSGGVLQAAGNSTAFMAKGVANAANVQANGAIIDTNGFAITIGQPLVSGVTGGTDGGLTVNSSSGTGTLTLAGTNTYSGQTTINPKATLQLGNGTSGNDGTIAATAGVTDNGTLAFNRYGPSNSAAYAIGGAGGVTKLGAGTQALTGSSNYTGATNVSAGTLALTGTGSINSTAGISVGAGAKFLQLSTVASTVPITLSGTLDGTTTVGSTTVNAGGIVNNGNGSTGALSLNALTYLGAATDNLNVANNTSVGLNVINALTLGSGAAVRLNLRDNGARFTAGTFELIQFGSSNVTNGNVNSYFTVGTGLAGSQTGTLSVAGGYVDLTVAGNPGSGLDRWTGSVNNVWDTSATTNWTDVQYGGAIPFAAGDAVVFDDVGSPQNTNPINISSGTVLPASVTFNNSSVTYAITGPYGIGDFSSVTPTTLTKNNAGTVALGTSSNYSGGTILNAGTLDLNNASAIGTGTFNIAGGTIDNTSGSPITLSTNNAQLWAGSFAFGGTNALNLGTGAVTLAGNETVTVNGTGALTVGGAISNASGGAYGLTKAGAGTLTLTGNATYTGTTVVSGGTLAIVGAANTISIGKTSSVTITGGTLGIVGDNNYLGPASTVPTTIGAGGTLTIYAATSTAHLGPLTLAGGTLASTGTPAGDGLTYGSFNLDKGVVAGGTPTTSIISAVNVDPTETGGTVFNVASGTTATGIDLDVTGSLTTSAGVGDTGIVKTGTGTMRLSGTNTYVGATTVSAGTLIVNTTGAITATTTVAVGTVAGAPAAVYQSGLVTNTSTAGGGFTIGNVAGGFGYYNMASGATLNVGGEIDPGGSGGGAGTFGQLDVAGGATINLPNISGTYFLPDRGAAGEVSVTNVAGTVQIAGSGLPTNNGINGLAVGLNNVGSLTSTVTLSGSAQFLTPSLTVKLNDTNFGAAGNATNVSVLNLDGGTLQTLGFGAGANQATVANGNAYAILNLDGGTIKAGSAANTTFLTGLGSAVVYGGGGTFDNNGVAITIGQNLTSATGLGVATVPVTAGGSGYLVPPQVVFTSSDGAGNGATGYATLNPLTGAVTGIVVTNPGTGYDAAPTVTLTPSGSGTGATIGTVATATNTAGALTFRGAGTTTLTGTNTYAGPTSITGGTVSLTGTGSINGTSLITVNGTGAKFLDLSSVVSTAPITLTTGTLDGTGTVGATTVGAGTGAIIANGNGTTTRLTIGGLTYLGAAIDDLNLANASNGALSVGALATNSTSGLVGLNLLLNGGAFASGTTYDLINYTSFLNNGVTASNASSEFTILSGLGARQTGTLTLVPSGPGGYLALTVTGATPNSLFWTGATSTTWQSGVTGNFDLAASGTPSAYYDGDFPTFDDRGTTGTVNIAGASVAPGATVFNNSVLAYTVSSSGGYGIAGTGSLTKNGTGAVTLATTNTYTGGTVLNSGTLNLTGSLASTGGLTVGGTSTFSYAPATAGATQAFASTAFAAGKATVNAAAGSTLALGTVTRTTGAAVAFNTSGVASTITGPTTSQLTNGILPWATEGSGSAATFATVSGTTVVSYTGATVESTTTSAWGGIPSGSGVVNYNVTITGTPGATGLNRTINSLEYSGAGLNQNGNTAATLMNTNAILNVGTGPLNLSTGGTIFNIAPAATNELVLAAVNNAITVGGPIVDNTAASALTVTGPNTVTLSGAGTFTGNVYVDGGTLVAGYGVAGANNTAGALGNTQTGGKTVTVGGGATLDFTVGNVFGNSGTTLAPTLIVKQGGTFQTGAASGSTFNALDNVTLSGGTILVGNGYGTTIEGLGLVTGSTVTVNGSSPSTIGVVVGATYDGIHLGTAAPAINSQITFNVADVTNNFNADLIVSAPLYNAITSSNGSVSTGLNKTGAGSMQLTAASTYTGGTTVSAGTLIASNATSSLGTGTATVTGGVLAGTGATGGPVTISGGTLSTGSGATAYDSIGTLTTTTQNWSSGTFVDKVANTTGGAGVGNGVLVMSGLTIPNPAGFTVSLLATNGSSPSFAASNATVTSTPVAGSYIILAEDSEGSGSPFNNPATVAALNLTNSGVTVPAGTAVDLAGYFDGANYDLIAEDVSTATPEPTSLLLLGAAAAPLALGRRRRASRRRAAGV
jgi:fibronectin-binding autotransporter adhesin